jgi:hypothetical protein
MHDHRKIARMPEQFAFDLHDLHREKPWFAHRGLAGSVVKEGPSEEALLFSRKRKELEHESDGSSDVVLPL